MNLGRGWQRIATASSSSDLSHYLQFYMGNILSNVTSVHDRKRGQYKLLFYPENTAFCTTRERVYRARRYIWLSDTNGQQALYITMHSAWATRLPNEGKKEQGKYISVFISVPLACNMHYGISHIIKEALIFIPLASNTRHRATRVMGQHA